MNEVMTLAEDEGLNIWYQDTDSMHINYEEVELLALAFKSKCNRYLIGEDMSQFHIDFDLNGACGEICLLYTSPSPRDLSTSRMPSSA